MLQEFICTRTCVHGKRYIQGRKIVANEDDLPHDVKTGELIHFKPVVPGVGESNINIELATLRKQIAVLTERLEGKERDGGADSPQVTLVNEGPDVAELPTNQALKERLTSLEIEWKMPINKTQLIEKLPSGQTFQLTNGSTWMKE
jgi:hypothetical protein